jgi:hypothetical protein
LIYGQVTPGLELEEFVLTPGRNIDPAGQDTFWLNLFFRMRGPFIVSCSPVVYPGAELELRSIRAALYTLGCPTAPLLPADTGDQGIAGNGIRHVPEYIEPTALKEALAIHSLTPASND